MARILITGVCGFCGGHLVNLLRADGISTIYGADIHGSRSKFLNLTRYFALDITDEEQVNQTIRSVQPDMVFHLAGKSSGTALEIYRANFLGGVHLLQAISKFAPHARVLMVGSAAEYGYVPEEDMPIVENHPCNPITPYGISKYSATLAALNYADSSNIKVVVARPFNIVGAGVPSSMVIGAVLERAKQALARQGEAVVTVGNLDTERDFISVEDVVNCYTQLIQREHWGQVYNICSGHPKPIRSLVEQILQFSDRPIRLKVDPVLCRPTDVPRVYGSMSKLKASLGFVPNIALENTLKSAWDYAIEGSLLCG